MTAGDFNKFVRNDGVTLGNIGAGLIDAMDQPNAYGRQSVAGTTAKSTLSMASAGASIGGPVGAGVGAGIGLVSGLFRGLKDKKKQEIDELQERLRFGQNLSNRSQARVAADPSLVVGNANASYFKMGGFMGPGEDDPTKPTTSADEARQAKLQLARYKKLLNDPVNVGYSKYSGIVNGDGDKKNPTQFDYIVNMAEYMKNNSIYSNVYRPEFEQYSVREVNPYKRATLDTIEPTVGMAKFGGPISGVVPGGNLQQLSSDSVNVNGNSHAQGGVQLGGAEVEGDETIKGNYVFSKALGFSKLHRPIAKAKGIIEQKPVSRARINSLQLLESQERKLMNAQEFLRNTLKLG